MGEELKSVLMLIYTPEFLISGHVMVKLATVEVAIN